MTVKVGRCLLHDRLKIAKISQIELAYKINMKPSQLSDYANNRKTMSLKNAKLIADALRCSIDDLYEWIRPE